MRTYLGEKVRSWYINRGYPEGTRLPRWTRIFQKPYWMPLGSERDKIIRLAIERGFTEVDVRDYRLLWNVDMYEIRMWNHLRIRVHGREVYYSYQPTRSNHSFGLAFDFVNKDEWLKQYDLQTLIHAYAEMRIKNREPWHFKYISE